MESVRKQIEVRGTVCWVVGAATMLTVSEEVSEPISRQIMVPIQWQIDAELRKTLGVR